MASHEHSSRRTGQPEAGSQAESAGTPRRRRRTRPQPPTSLQVVASTFALVTTGPGALEIDGKQVGHGLPRRLIGPDELRAIMVHPATRRSCREAVWRLLSLNARTHGPAWLIGAAGVALPELMALADDVTETLHREAADVHAAVLSGFIDGLTRIDVDQPGIVVGLRWMAYHAAITSTRNPVPRLASLSSPPPRPIASAEKVLSGAVASGVLSPVQAKLISAIRIDNLPLVDAAAQFGISREVARQALQRGEAALAAVGAGDVRDHRFSTDISRGPAVAGPRHRPGCVRGRSTCSDGTSETNTSASEEGVFCSPAHHPTPAAEPPHQPQRNRGVRRRRTRVRCARPGNGGASPRHSGQPS